MAQLLKAIVDTQKNNYKAIGQVNAYDNLELELEIKMNGVNVEFVNPSFELISKKADGNRVRQLKDISYADRKIKIIVDDQITACSKSGIVSNQLIIKDEGRMSTCLFYFLLGSSLDREIIQSIDKVEVLEQLDEYVVTAFANLDEFEKRIITGEATIRKLNDDMTAAENSREESETNRVNNESNRVSKEKERELAETERGSNEKTRKDSELVRVEAEKTREQQEDIRQRNYILKENERDDNYASAEIERNRAFNLEESKRARQEDVRGTNEIAREEAERNRTISESYRSDKESERVIAEKTRADNEAARIKNENARETAETTRSRNETSRVEAEKTRVAEFEQIKKDNTIFKEGVTADYNAFTEEVENQILNSKTDYFGKEHTSVDERLNEDFDNIHQRVNNSEYLPYEGSNITANNSYYGLTKDMIIKGRTLQNIISDGVLISSEKTLTNPTNTNITLVSTEPFSLVKNNTVYSVIIFADIKTNSMQELYCQLNYEREDGSQNSVFRITSDNFGKVVKTTMRTDIKRTRTIFIGGNGGSVTINRFKVLLLEGDYTNTPLSELPYIAGIQSVGDLVTDVNSPYYGKYKVEGKSTGKNLFRITDDMTKTLNGITVVFNKEKQTINVNGTVTGSDTYFYISSYPFYVDILQNATYTLSMHKLSGSADISNTRRKSIGHIGLRDFNNDTIFNYSFMSKSQTKNVTSKLTGESWFRLDAGVVFNDFTFNLMFEESEISTTYEPYISDTKVYYLDEPIGCSPNGVADTIEEIKVVIRNGSTTLVGTENWQLNGVVDNRIGFSLIKNGVTKTPSTPCISDTLPWNSTGTNRINTGYGAIYVFLDKEKLVTPDVEGFKAWLKVNPTTVYYELDEPIIIPLDEELTLKTFDTTTHITSNNYLLPKLSAKVPSNVQAVVSGLRTENEVLKTDLKIMNLVTEENNIKNIETNLDQEARLTMIEMGVI